MNEIQQLENKLKYLRMEEWRKKQADQATRKSNFLAENKHDVYHASDYVGEFIRRFVLLRIRINILQEARQ